MNDNYLEGAYYYTLGCFFWGDHAVYRDPSIYAIRENGYIWIPYLKPYMKTEGSDVMYLPFVSEGMEVKLKYG